jgi:antiviral helicase SKI2
MAGTMPDTQEHVMDQIDQILNPRREDADQILEDLGLAGFPTRDKVHQEIEAKFLLPPDRIPEHWLPTYQMHVQDLYMP